MTQPTTMEVAVRMERFFLSCCGSSCVPCVDSAMMAPRFQAGLYGMVTHKEPLYQLLMADASICTDLPATVALWNMAGIPTAGA